MAASLASLGAAGCPPRDGVTTPPEQVDDVSDPDDIEATPQPCLSVIPDTEIRITATLYFDAGQASISEESAAVLDEIAEVLRDNPDLRVTVVGHCDFTEGVCASQERAEAVRAGLVERGVAAPRLSVRDAMAGELDADGPGAEPGAERSRNRRVTFEVE